MIQIISLVIVGFLILLAASAVNLIVESILDGLKNLLLIVLAIAAIVGFIALQIYLIGRWGLAVIGAYTVTAVIALVIYKIYKHPNE